MQIYGNNLHEKLSKVFKEATRNEAAATLFSYQNLETNMFRARLEQNPPFPALQLNLVYKYNQQLRHETQYIRGHVLAGSDIGVPFYSDKVSQVLA